MTCLIRRERLLVVFAGRLNLDPGLAVKSPNIDIWEYWSTTTPALTELSLRLVNLLFYIYMI
jgi:hypothetical protein